MTGSMLYSPRVKKRAGKVGLYIVLSLVGVTMIVPFIWMLLGSIMHEADIMQANWGFPQNPQWRNYAEVFRRVPYVQFYMNTFKIAGLATVLQLAICALAAYAFARLSFKGRDFVFLCFLSTMMIPSQVTMIPQYVLLGWFGMLNTHMALIILRATSVFGIFMLRQFFMTLPNELSESARIDGCNEFGIFARIILPLSKAVLATLTIFSFMGAWNDFMSPLIYLTTKSKFTLQIGIRYFQQQYGTEYTLIMAATSMSLVPVVILYLICQRYFIAGIATTGMKG